jgi:hypothetical protein
MHPYARQPVKSSESSDTRFRLNIATKNHGRIPKRRMTPESYGTASVPGGTLHHRRTRRSIGDQIAKQLTGTAGILNCPAVQDFIEEDDTAAAFPHPIR